MFICFKRSVIRAAAILAGVQIFNLAAATIFAQQPYQIIDQWKIGGTGTWDYLVNDPSAHILYVTHRTSVEVIDTGTGKVVASIQNLKNAHGVALDGVGRFGYISDGLSNDVVVFDRHSFKPVTTVPTGTNPDGITFDSVTKTVWVFNGKTSNVTVIDTATNKAVATIELPGKPEFPVADGAGSVYDNLESISSIVRLDVRTKKIKATWKLEGCEAPTGLAFDPEHRRLFAVCDNNKMAVVNADTGKVLAIPAIGDSPDAAAYSSKRQLAFSSNGGGTLTVVDTANGYKVIGNLALPKGAATLAYDAETDRIFMSVAEYGPAPASTAKSRHPVAPMLPDSFKVLVLGRK